MTCQLGWFNITGKTPTPPNKTENVSSLYSLIRQLGSPKSGTLQGLSLAPLRRLPCFGTLVTHNLAFSGSLPHLTADVAKIVHIHLIDEDSCACFLIASPASQQYSQHTVKACQESYWTHTTGSKASRQISSTKEFPGRQICSNDATKWVQIPWKAPLQG